MSLEKERPEFVVILAGDHIYKMNYKSMVQYHLDVGADVTVGALRVDPVAARQFGVMEIDTNQRIVGFEEKVPNPKTIPGDPNHCLGSMGIYVFAARFLFEAAMPRCDAAGQPARFWPRHHSVADRKPQGVRVSVSRREPQDRRVLARRRARSTPITKPTWI